MTLRIRGPRGDAPFPARGGAGVVQYSSAQYAWLDLGPNSRPTRDLPPARFRIGPGPLSLPAMSLTVVTAPLF
jgi:hypothetical protein